MVNIVEVNNAKNEYNIMSKFKEDKLPYNIKNMIFILKQQLLPFQIKIMI